MDASSPFADLLRRLRAGEEQAVRELVADYEPYLRRTIRRRLARTPLQAVADSADVCQSVLAGFMLRIVAGDFVLSSRQDLTKLLLGMVKNKLAALARHESAQCRDRGRTQSLGSNPQIPAKADEEPSRVTAGRDLLVEVNRRLLDEDRALFEMRQDGESWQVIAERLGQPAVVLRKRLSRALRRVAVELGLEASDEFAE